MIDNVSHWIGAAGLGYLAVICVLLPWAAWKTRRRSKDAPPIPRQRYFASALQTSAFLGLLGLLVAHFEEIELFPSVLPGVKSLALGALAVIVLMIAMKPYREHVARTDPKRMQLFAEPTPKVRALWVAISLSAGFWEEIVFRGVTTTLLARWSGSVPLAIAVSMLAFGAAHLTRGITGAALTTVIAGVLHVLVFAAGALYVAMAVHFVYDVLAGFAYMKLARKLAIRRVESG
jgi:membrane protease YdiL (CAAX protease family)